MRIEEDSLTPWQKLQIKAGCALFGIDSEYLIKVQKREIFELIGHGFSFESLKKMPIEERRFYFHLLVEKNQPTNQ
jgi:hypothetical protein